MSKLQQLEKILKKHNFWAKKSLGQNFLIDDIALDKIVEAGDLNPDDNIIEVGPGTGFLTERLIEKVKKVTAIELDRDMITVLEDRFKDADNLELINKDILKVESEGLGVKGKYKVIANIPYYITSPLIKYFLKSKNRPTIMVILMQKEVAEKICGISGKSVITIETQLFADVEIVHYVPSSSFHPAPKVNSAVLKITVFDEPLLPENELKDFLRIVKFAFSQKRKKLSNTLSAGLRMEVSDVKKILEKANINPDLRAEHLKIEDWKRLVKIIN